MAFIYGGEEERKGQHHPQSFREAVGPGCVVCNDHSFHDISDRLRVVPIFPQGQSERNVKIIPTRERRDAVGRAASSRVEPRRAWDDFHTRSLFARSSIPEQKWGLLVVYISDIF